MFGHKFKWHPDSTFLAFQEWLTIDNRKGTITALNLIDLETGKYARISKAGKGFIKPVKFDHGTIIFEKESPASGKIDRYEIKLDEINNWE